MSDVPSANTFRVVTADHASGTINDMVGGNVTYEVGTVESLPGARLTPCTAVNRVAARCMLKSQARFAPIAPGTVGSVVFTLLEMDNSTTGTVTVADQMAGEWRSNFDQQPHIYEQNTVQDSGDSENIACISVA